MDAETQNRRLGILDKIAMFESGHGIKGNLNEKSTSPQNGASVELNVCRLNQGSANARSVFSFEETKTAYCSENHYSTEKSSGTKGEVVVGLLECHSSFTMKEESISFVSNASNFTKEPAEACSPESNSTDKRNNEDKSPSSTEDSDGFIQEQTLLSNNGHSTSPRHSKTEDIICCSLEQISLTMGQEYSEENPSGCADGGEPSIEASYTETTSVYIRTEKRTEKDAGFDIQTTEKCNEIQHRILVAPKDNGAADEVQCSIAEKLQLKTGDTLLAINDVNVSTWLHGILLVYMKYMLVEGGELLTLLVGRLEDQNDHSSTMVLLEITCRIDYLSRGSSGSCNLPDAAVTCVEIVPPVKGVKFQSVRTVKIKHLQLGLFLKINKKKKLRLKPYKDKPAYLFKTYAFCGITYDNGCIESPFFSVFHNMKFGGYIIAHNSEKVGALCVNENDCMCGNYDVRQPPKTLKCADPRFFTTHQTEMDSFYMESLVHSDCFMTCVRQGLKIKIKLKKNTSALEWPGTFPDAEFDIQNTS